MDVLIQGKWLSAGDPAGVAEAGRCSLPSVRQLWRHTLGDPRVCIAILDGPVDLSHRCLRGARLTTRGRFGRSCYGQGACLHGTHVASLIFAQHGTGPLKGVAPRCRGIVIPVFSDAATVKGGIYPCSQKELARAIEAAVGYGARIINISAGQPGHAGTADPRLLQAVELCARRGVLIVAAAGNDGCDCLHLPAALPAVLAVGAYDTAGVPSQSSNFGGTYQNNGLVAPGLSILGASPGGSYDRLSGTSFATPLVSGLAGLLLSAKLLHRGYFTASDAREVHEALLRSAAPCGLNDQRECRRLLAGSVDPLRAFDLYLKGGIEMDQLEDSVVAPVVSRPVPAAELTGDVACAQSDITASSSGNSPPTAEQSGRASTDYQSEKEDRSRKTARGRTLPNSSTSALASSECGCQRNGGLVYALGELGYDFGSQARLDAIDAEMDEGKFATMARDLLEFLTREGGASLYFASAIIWTLNHDATPMYALQPSGPFARETYARLLEFFQDQIDEKAERVCVPGVLNGSVTLLSGQELPVVVPDLRGLFNWKTSELIQAVVGQPPEAEGKRREFNAKVEGMHGFLERIYFEVRNTGQTPQERALNFAATNAFNVERVFESASKRQLQLDEIHVEQSPICRPDSDCWDVVLIFFDPADTLGHARTAYRFTVDVSDVVPVLVGLVRSWAVR